MPRLRLPAATVSALLVSAGVVVGSEARAEDPTRMWARYAREAATELRMASWFAHTDKKQGSPQVVDAPAPRGPGNRIELRFALRDGTQSVSLRDEHLPSDEAASPMSTCRMVSARLGFVSGRFALFAKLGIGDLRVDRARMPTLQNDRWSAAQLGTGVEIRASRQLAFTAQVDDTVLYMPRELSHAHVVGAFLGARGTF